MKSTKTSYSSREPTRRLRPLETVAKAVDVDRHTLNTVSFSKEPRNREASREAEDLTGRRHGPMRTNA
jgi:hypothetical protein